MLFISPCGFNNYREGPENAEMVVFFPGSRDTEMCNIENKKEDPVYSYQSINHQWLFCRLRLYLKILFFSYQSTLLFKLFFLISSKLAGKSQVDLCNLGNETNCDYAITASADAPSVLSPHQSPWRNMRRAHHSHRGHMLTASQVPLESKSWNTEK